MALTLGCYIYISYDSILTCIGSFYFINLTFPAHKMCR